MSKKREIDEAEYRSLIDRSMEELRLKTAAHDAGWGLGAADWAVDQNTGLITFTGKKVVATAPVQIIGTYNTQDGTWLWAWDHPSVADDLAEDARRVLAYAKEHGIAPLTARLRECSEGEAWEFTALACHLCGSQGAYRGPAGPTLVFMTFGEVTLSARFEVTPADEMRARYGLTAENRPSVRLDPMAVPQGLRHLIPLAERFGVSDDLIREDIVAKTSPTELASMRAAVASADDAFDDWLAGPEAAGPRFSPEYIAFSCLRMAALGV